MEYSGLEGAELVMEIESSFGIKISDAEAARIVTDRDLVEYLSKRMGAKEGECTIAVLALARLQDAVVRAIGIAHEQILLESSWNDLLPAGEVSRYWQAIEAIVGARLHPLGTRPGAGWIELGLALACLVAPGLLIVVLAEQAGMIPAVVGVALLLGALAIFALRVQRSLVGFPPGYETVKDTAHFIAAHNAKLLKAEGQWTTADINFVVSTLTRELYSC